MMHCCRPLIMLLLVLAPLWASAQEGRGSLEIELQGLAPGQGNVLVYLYDNPKDWLKTKRAQQQRTVPAARAETMTLRFADLPVGEYAVSVVQDVNGNGKLDARRIIPIPREPTGLSNNHRSAGKPSYKKAKFTLGASLMRLEILLRPCPGRCIQAPSGGGQ